MTILLTLIMMTFFTFCLVLTEGIRIYYERVCAQQAMELAEYSVLSDYQKELFDQYGVFFLDLDYEQGEESVGVLEARAEKYLTANTGEVFTKALCADGFRRATDYEGQAFYQQAAELMRVKSGISLWDIVSKNAEHIGEEEIDLMEEASKNISKVESEEGLLKKGLPVIAYPSLKSFREAVLGNVTALSAKEIDISERISNRRLMQGTKRKEESDLAELLLFQSYLFEHFSYYGRDADGFWTDSLEYQLEYIICGKDSDLKNLEQVLWKIFLLRAGSNYLFFHQDVECMAAAEAKAIAFAAVTGNAALVEACREIFLIIQAIEEGLSDTKRIFSGEKVAFYEGGIFQGFEVGYADYLYLFLNTLEKEDMLYRCMDVVELEVRKKSGYEKFRLDHCVDACTLQWTYQYNSLFLNIPLMDGSVYESTITKEIEYKR